MSDNPSGGPLADAPRKIPRTQPEEARATSETADAGPPHSDDGVVLVAGASIADGRYRLLVFHGGPEHLQFWQALDTALDRQVALTFIDPGGALPDSEVSEILARTMRLSRVECPGIARILDVTDTGTGGLVVAEWIRGGSLQEVADTAPSPIGGARAVQSLASAAEAAHQVGVALSLDHPSRIRVSVEGDVVLAFPATFPDATPEDDIRGTGAALYALLVNRWPLPETGTASGLEQAAQDSAGQPVEPRSVDRSIPFQISAAAARSVQEGGGIRTAPTLLNLLQQATAVADRTELIEPVESTRGPGDRAEADDSADAASRRRRALLIGGGIAGAILLVALIVLASVLSRIFGDVGGGLNSDQLGLNPQTSTSADDSPGGVVVKPVRATVFSPEGEADAPELADLAIDGNPATVWPTDTYSDPAPFPGFKNGVGLMLELSEPATIGTVTINVSGTGTAVQIRSASSPSPTQLEDTKALTDPTTLQRGNNTIKVDAAEPTSNVLVWISTLGTVDGKSRTDISEITLRQAQ